MKHALVLFGILAAIALAAPSLVVLGYFLLIVPGLILTIAPTMFVYLVATSIIRRTLPIDSSVAATVVAFLIAVLGGCLVMQPFRMRAIANYQTAQQPDVMPDQQIQLTGNVRIEMPSRKLGPACDALCLAALDSPQVDSVTIACIDSQHSSCNQEAGFQLVDANPDSRPGIFPNDPGQIVRHYRPLAKAQVGKKFTSATKAVEAEWALRLCGPQRIRSVVPVDAGSADWTLRIESRRDRDSRFRRVTMTDSDGVVHLRLSYQRQSVPASMFYLGFRCNFSTSMLSSASFGLGRQKLQSGDPTLDPETSWLESIEFSLPTCDLNNIAKLRDQALLVINDPSASEAQLELTRRFLDLFFFDSKEPDHGLIAQIVADKRVTNLDQPLQNLFSKQKTPAAMRDAFAERIVMTHTSTELRYRLAECLAAMPEGTFANPTATHWKIWNTPELRQQTGPFVSRIADAGPQQALPVLLSMLEDVTKIPHWRDRRAMVHGIREAFVQLGPQANTAVQPVTKLFLQRPSPILSNSGDANDWRFTLTRMGVPIEDLPMFPSHSQSTIDRIHRNVADKVRRYEKAQLAPDEA
ncbi:hypothetical protein LOC71_09205 [Rhodopirellula sp. JC740]|uniref:Uncharacterized protein n=1 Tax=Rhodopirellula halodulae TaxID=2894198 RepID=A0ABS8NFZ3_9BACT|nr:hypothetical protein [Rhodopirellula sp. JC740]MCC9642450.1 hypothetical protein [Rhodopirellula sp. JC740]